MSASAGDDVPPALKTPTWQRQVDVDLDVYFGRAEQGIREITELVARGPCGSITSIRGVGGIGKTASAYEAVRGAVHHYSMVAWASFRQHQNPRALERGESVGRSSREVLRDFSEQLGLTINSSDAVIIGEFSRALRRLSTEERVLLVVDNLERLSDVREIVDIFSDTNLLQACHLLLTSRPSAAQMSRAVTEREIGNLSLRPSCELIRHEGRESREIASADDEELAPIHRVVDGNPYLMKLLARRLCVQARPLDLLLEDVRLIDRTRNDHPSAMIQQYMFSSSLIQLSELTGEDEAMSLIHAFGAEPPGSRIPYAALQTISALPDGTFQDALDAARALSLVNVHGLNESFSIHSLLHSYTTETVTPP